MMNPVKFEQPKASNTMAGATFVFRVVEIVFNIILIGLAGVYCNGNGNCPLDFMTHYDVEGQIFVLFVVVIGILISGAYLIRSCVKYYDNSSHSAEISLIVGMVLLMGISAVLETYYAADIKWTDGRIWKEKKQPQWIAAAVIAWANTFLYCFDACYLCIAGRVVISQAETR